MTSRALAVLLVLLALGAGMVGLAAGVYGLDQASRNSAALRQLLLDGKTASAISAKRTAQEVNLLLQQQAFDHAQTQSSEKRLKFVVRQVERHLDRTILRAIDRAAVTAVKKFRR